MRYAALLLVFLMGCSDAGDGSEPSEVLAPDTASFDEVEGDSSAIGAVVLQPGLNNLTLEQEVEGVMVERSYIVHVPDTYSDTTAPTPILLAFHGAGGVGADFVEQFQVAVDKGDFVGVYPDGLENSWNVKYEDSKADDVAFASMLVQSLQGVPGIDTSKPVAVGFSNGAALTHKIAIETDLVVAIAPHVSQLLKENQPQPAGKKVSVMQLLAADDSMCPYDGGVGILGYDFMPGVDSAATWAAHNGCDSDPVETQVGEHVKMEWENCEEGRQVIHYRVNGFDHAIPPNVDGNTTARIMEFLIGSRQ